MKSIIFNEVEKNLEKTIDETCVNCGELKIFCESKQFNGCGKFENFKTMVDKLPGNKEVSP